MIQEQQSLFSHAPVKMLMPLGLSSSASSQGAAEWDISCSAVSFLPWFLIIFFLWINKLEVSASLTLPHLLSPSCLSVPCGKQFDVAFLEQAGPGGVCG